MIPKPNGAAGEPRAFVTATGYVFQIVGLVFSLGGCCLWSLSGWFLDSMGEPVDRVGDYLRVDALARTMATAGMVTTFLGGLGLVAVGTGLQAERRRSGRWALAVTGLFAVMWWALLVIGIVTGLSLWNHLLAGLLAGVGTVLFLMAGNSARLLKEFPPPEHPETVPPEFLEEYSRHRSD